MKNFEKQWNKFVLKFKGKLLSESKKQTLNYPLVCILLRDAKLGWESDYNEGGRWLKEVKTSYPEKGERIQDILLNIKLSAVKVPTGIPELLDYLVPIVGAALGFVISTLLKARLLIRIASIILPAIVLYLIMRKLRSMIKANNDRQILQKYMDQLNKYKKNIENIIDE